MDEKRLAKTINILAVFTILVSGFFLSGCSNPVPKPKQLVRTEAEQSRLINKTIKYMAKAVKDFHEEELAVEPGSKVFIINVFPDDKTRAKAMFNYAIKLMNEKGLCYKNAYDKDSVQKCTKAQVVLTKDGETANLKLDSLDDKWSATDAASAIYQFNKTYFPGFLVVRPEATLGAIKNLEIYNEQLDKEIYKNCRLDGYLEKFAKRQNIKIVNDPDDADYVLMYQRVGCSSRYITHQPPMLINILKNSVKNNDVTVGDNNKFQVYTYGGSGGVTGAVLGAGVGNAASGAFNLYATPTISAFGVLGAFMPTYKTVKGVAYEYILVDKKQKAFFHHTVEKSAATSDNVSEEKVLHSCTNSAAAYLLQ